MDIQVILVFILALLTVNLIVVGVYVVLVLREFRETIKKANVVLENVEKVSNLFSNPITTLVGVATAFAQGFKAVKSITSLKGISEKEQ